MLIIENDHKRNIQIQKFTRQYFVEKRGMIFLEGFCDESYANDPTMPFGWSTSPRGVIDQILFLVSANATDPIRLFINCPGGDIVPCLRLHDLMTAIPLPIHTITHGMAASSAALILAAGKPGHRFLFPNSRMMISLPKEPGRKGHPGVGFHADTSREESEHAYVKLLAKYCKKSEADIGKMMDRWLDAEESVAFGLADRVITGWSDIRVNFKLSDPDEDGGKAK